MMKMEKQFMILYNNLNAFDLRMELRVQKKKHILFSHVNETNSLFHLSTEEYLFIYHKFIL